MRLPWRRGGLVVAELMQIANALLGTQDIVPDPAGLRADFASMMQTSLGRQVGAVTLRVWTPPGRPRRRVEADGAGRRPHRGAGRGKCVDRRVPHRLVGRRVAGLPPEPCGSPRRDRRREDGGRTGDARRRRRGGRPGAGARQVWTDDAALSTRINRRVAEVMGETELADAIQGWGRCAAGRRHRDGHRRATAGRCRLAHEIGNSEVLDRLSKLVDIEDPATGRVKPKAKVEEVDVMIAESRSVRTERTGR